jgi:prepilin-type N-terminal cleavage/methylation domain-containing protein
MNRQRGFTLVELLVAISIIATISAASLVYFRGGNKNWSLIRATQTFTQDIRRMSNMALSSPKITGSSVDYQPKGYGIYLNKTGAADTYIIFGNMDSSNNAYDAPTSGCYSTGSDVIIETITMESGTKISGLAAPGSVDYISIVFVPPDPIVNFSNGASNMTAVLSLSDSSQTKQVTVNSKGNINIE